MEEFKVVLEHQKKSRIIFIDWARLIGIFLVILGHLNLKNQTANTMINSFHMPLFFFLSGIFLDSCSDCF